MGASVLMRFDGFSGPLSRARGSKLLHHERPIRPGSRARASLKHGSKLGSHMSTLVLKGLALR